MKADLHTHSTASDGTDAPAELARKGRSVGLEVMALTDHDTLDGTQEFLHAFGPGALAGIEVCAPTPKGSLHLVGLGVDSEYAPLQEALAWVREQRQQRAEKMLSRIQEQRIDISLDEVLQHVGPGGVLARPHFARTLMEKGYVSSIAEAFERYLAAGRPCYVPNEHLSSKEYIDLFHRAGGVAVLAHPYFWSEDLNELAAGVTRLHSEGLDALEAYYTGYGQGQVLDLLRLANRFRLAVSIGSDYHGQNKPSVHLGALPDTECVTVLELLK